MPCGVGKPVCHCHPRQHGQWGWHTVTEMSQARDVPTREGSGHVLLHRTCHLINSNSLERILVWAAVHRKV